MVLTRQKSLRVKRTRNPADHFGQCRYTELTILAVKAGEDEYWLCQLQQNVLAATKNEVCRIFWLEELEKEKGVYVAGTEDFIHINSILCKTHLVQKGGTDEVPNYVLKDGEDLRIRTYLEHLDLSDSQAGEDDEESDESEIEEVKATTKRRTRVRKRVEDEDEEFDEKMVSPRKRRRRRSTVSGSSTPKSPAKKGKGGKKVSKKRGQPEPNFSIKIPEIDPTFDDTNTEIKDFEGDSVQAIVEVHRAIKIGNRDLLNKCFEDRKIIHNINQKDRVGKGALQPCELAIKYKNFDMIQLLKKEFTREEKDKNPDLEKPRVWAPAVLLKEAGTGSQTGIRSYHERKTEISRGNRQGNTAFAKTHDHGSPSNFMIGNSPLCNGWSVDAVVKYAVKLPITKETNDFLKEIFDKSDYLNNKTCRIKDLTCLVKCGNHEVALYLAEKMKGDTNNGLTPYFIDCLTDKDMGTIKSQSVTKNVYGLCGIKPLHFACISPYPKQLQGMLTACPQFALADEEKCLPVHFGATNENPIAIRILLERNSSDPFLKDKKLNNALHYAARTRRPQNILEIAKATLGGGLAWLEEIEKYLNDELEELKSNEDTLQELENIPSGASDETPIDETPIEESKFEEETTEEPEKPSEDEQVENPVSEENMEVTDGKEGEEEEEEKEVVKVYKYDVLPEDTFRIAKKKLLGGLTVKNKKGNTPLHLAVISGDVLTTKIICKILEGINKKVATVGDVERCTAMHIAAELGYIDIMEMLYADFNHKLEACDKFKRTPIIMAALNGQLKSMAWCLRFGSDPNSVDSSDNSVLHYAAAYGWLECVKFLLANGAELNPENSWKLTPLAIAMLNGKHQICSYLLNLDDVNVNFKDSDGNSIIFMELKCALASVDGSTKMIEFLLNEKKADPTSVDTNGENVFHLLAKTQCAAKEADPKIQTNRRLHLDLADILLKHGVDVLQRNKKGETPFDIAVANNNIEFAEFFVDKGAQFDSVSEEGHNTCLHTMLRKFCSGHHKEMLGLLTRLKKSNPEALQKIGHQFNKEGLTPFMDLLLSLDFRNKLQAMFGKDQFVELLVKESTKGSESQSDDEKEDSKKEEEEEEEAMEVDEIGDENISDDDSCDDGYDDDESEDSYDDHYDEDDEEDMYIDNNNIQSTEKDIQLHDIMTLFKFAAEENWFDDVCIRKWDEVKDKTDNGVARLRGGARTKQTARKSTGGKAPRKMLGRSAFGGFGGGFGGYQQQNDNSNEQHNESKTVGFTALHALLQLIFFPFTLRENKIDSALALFKELVGIIGAEKISKWIDKTDKMGRTPIHRFILDNKNCKETESVLKYLTSLGASLNKQDTLGKSLIHESVHDSDLRKFLASHKDELELNIVDKEHRTALMTAVMRNCLDAINDFLDLDADITICDKFGRQPLQVVISTLAAQGDANFDILDRFLGHPKADIHHIDIFGHGVVHHAFISPNAYTTRKELDTKAIKFVCAPTFSDRDPIEVVRSLCVFEELNVDLGNHLSFTPLHYASACGAVVSALFLMKSNAKINNTSHCSNTPLSMAVHYSHAGMATILMEKGSDCNIRYNNVSSNLEMSSEDVSSALKKINEGLVIDIPKLPEVPEMNYTLFAGVVRKNLQGLEYLLLDNGFPLFEAIQDAISSGRINLVLNLLKKSQPSVLRKVNEDDETLLQVFCKHANTSKDIFIRILDVLLKAEVDINHRDKLGHTALHYTARRGLVSLCTVMVKRGANVTIRNNRGWTVIHCLMFNSPSPDVIRFLELTLQKLEIKELEKPVKCDISIKETGIGKTIITMLDGVMSEKQLKKYISKHKLKTQSIEVPLLCFASMDPFDASWLESFLSGGCKREAIDSKGHNVLWILMFQRKFNALRMILGEAPTPPEEAPMCPNFGYQRYYTDDGKIKTRKVNVCKNATFEHAISTRHEEGYEAPDAFKFDKNDPINVNLKYNNRSLIGHLVSPCALGHLGDVDILELLVKHGADVDSINEMTKKTPLETLSGRATDVMAKSLIELGATEPELSLQRAPSHISSDEWPIEIADYTKDAEEAIQIMNESASDDILAPKPLPELGLKDAMICQDDDGNYYDCAMTKVDVNASYYGRNDFYKLQLIHDKNLDVYLVVNCWGRIGESGRHQRTPYPSLETAFEEFEKIYKSKSGHTWKDTDRTPVEKCFTLVDIDRSVAPERCNLKELTIKGTGVAKSNLPKTIKNMMKSFTNVKALRGVMNNVIIDKRHLPLGRLRKDLLVNARDILGRVLVCLDKIDNLNNNSINNTNENESKEDNTKKTQEEIDNEKTLLRLEVRKLSNDFFRLVPRTESSTMDHIRALTKEDIGTYSTLLNSLLDVEIAVKIILAAGLKVETENPLDYAYRSLNTHMELLPKNSNDVKAILQTGLSGMRHSHKINIYKIQRHEEVEKFKKWESVPNHQLLWHGSSTTNFMGILNQGLRIAPPEAPTCGYMFGKGIYFADSFQKSHGYCRSDSDGRSYMILSEVALGRCLPLQHSKYIEDLPEGYDSTWGVGSMQPCNHLHLDNGVIIPVGGEQEKTFYTWNIRIENTKRDFDYTCPIKLDDCEIVDEGKQTSLSINLMELLQDKYYELHNVLRSDQYQMENVVINLDTLSTDGLFGPNDAYAASLVRAPATPTLHNNEFIVYDESRVRMRYLVEMVPKKS